MKKKMVGILDMIPEEEEEEEWFMIPFY